MKDETLDALYERLKAQADAKIRRKSDGSYYEGLHPKQTLEWQAAEAITRLRKAYSDAMEALSENNDENERLETEIARLRAKLTVSDEMIVSIVRDICELPDRTSSDDWPEAMLVTPDELTIILTRHLSNQSANRDAMVDAIHDVFMAGADWQRSGNNSFQGARDMATRACLTAALEQPDAEVIDLEREFFKTLCKAAGQSNWIPPDYMMNDWVSDCANFLRNGPPDAKEDIVK